MSQTMCLSRNALRSITTTKQHNVGEEAIEDGAAHPRPQPQRFTLPLLLPVALPKDEHYLSLASSIVLEFNRRGEERWALL